MQEEKSGLDHSDYIWKTLFIEIEANSQLVQINASLSGKLSKYTYYEFKPHISLITKPLTNQKEKKIIRLVVLSFLQ